MPISGLKMRGFENGVFSTWDEVLTGPCAKEGITVSMWDEEGPSHILFN